MNNRKLRSKLMALRDRDAQMRRRLLEAGELFDGYHPEMERIHAANARALEQIIDDHGWPGVALVSDDGCDAAWLIAQHAIAMPGFQRRCRELIGDAVEAGDAPARHLALLIDRIRYNERQPQVYGSVFDWDEAGELSPWTIEAADGVEERRAAAGLEPLDEVSARLRAAAAGEDNRPPASHSERQREIEEWAREAGWMVP